MKNISSRHHYIPKLLIRGFTNEFGYVYIYDKEKQKILDKTRPPKSIFWEKDRNTFDFGRNKSTIIEDSYFSKIDNLAGEAILFLREIGLNELEIPISYIYKLQVFVLNLFWRIPGSDELFDIIYEIINSEIPYEIKSKDWLKKHQRTQIFILTINEIIKNLNTNQYKYKIIEFENDQLVLTDNPTLYKRFPEKFEDLDNSNYIFPISSKRMFMQSNQIKDDVYSPFQSKFAFWYNALSISQSKRYSAASSLDVLNKSLKIYTNIRDNNLVEETKDLLFNKTRF